MNADTVQTILLVLAGYAFVASATFVTLYHLVTGGAWRRTPTGRNVMLLMSVIVLAIGQIFAVRWFGMYPFRDIVSGFVYGTIGYAATQRIVLMLRAQAGSPDGRRVKRLPLDRRH